MVMRFVTADHSVEVDWGAGSWPTADAVSIADSPSIDSFTYHPEAEKLGVYLWERTPSSHLPGHDMALVGLAAATVSRQARSHSVIVVTIHALAIKEGSRKLGLGQALYARLHEAVFELGQWEYAARRADVAVLPFMELHVLPGGCRRRVDALTLYANNRWQITCNGGHQCITAAVLSQWLLDGTTLDGKDVQLSLPPVSLCGGYFSPVFDTDSHPVVTSAFNSIPSAASAVMIEANFVGRMLLADRCVIGPSQKLLSPQTGLLSFLLPAAPCRVLDDFLSDPDNWGAEAGAGNGGSFPVKALLVGGARLTGFDRYGNLNNYGHVPAVQASKTVMAARPAQVKALLLGAPCFATVVGAVLGQLGYQACSPEQVSSMLKAVHFFLVDSSRQTSYAWHTDDTDLNITKRRDKLRLRTVVLQLGAEARTAMQVHGFRPFAFEGRGAGALFHGAAVHRSVDLDHPPRAVWKVTLFLLLPVEQVAP